MIKWLKKKPEDVAFISSSTEHAKEKEQEAYKNNFINRFKQGLTKTRHQLGEGLNRIFHGKKEIDAELLEQLEMFLVSSDVGIGATKDILDKITSGLSRKELTSPLAVYTYLKQELKALLDTNNQSLMTVIEKSSTPFVILMVGVNGAGKTTTIGKLAKFFQQQDKKVMLAAGDTFRAAAVEQLQTWGERNNVAVIAQHTGADSASVIFDAFNAAKARKIDILIADTAGRLHTQNHLMDELKKVKKVLQKIDPNAPQEVMLVLDASIGQNALNQAKQFHDAIGVSGITMTKLDGTAKGGILFAIAKELNLPIRYVGLGEGVGDLKTFNAEEFIDAIFTDLDVE